MVCLAFAYVNEVVDYYRLSADKRLLYGGACNYSGRDPKSIKDYIVPRMAKVYPGLRDVRIDYEWGGMIGIVLNRIPALGRIKGNVYYCQGYSGHGVNATHIMGEIMADAVTGTMERFDLFADVPPVRIPGAHTFQKPMVTLGVIQAMIGNWPRLPLRKIGASVWRIVVASAVMGEVVSAGGMAMDHGEMDHDADGEEHGDMEMDHDTDGEEHGEGHDDMDEDEKSDEVKEEAKDDAGDDETEGKKKKAKKNMADVLIAPNPNNPYPVYKLFQKAHGIARDRLVASMALLGEADNMLKSSRQPPEVVLEWTVIRILGLFKQ